MTDHYRDIPSLLHDAELIGLQWEPQLASLRLLFTCLLRNVDGSTVRVFNGDAIAEHIPTILKALASVALV